MSKIKTSVLFTEEQVQKKVQELAQAINKQFHQQKIMAIGVLTGAFVFYSDLVRALDSQVVCDFCATSSYGRKDVPSPSAQLILDTCLDISGQHVLLIEDIVDRGLTLNFLQSLFKTRRPKSLTTVALVAKPQKIKYPCQLDYVGFNVDTPAFIVGYGMDYQEQFRHLPYIAQID